MRRVCFYHAGCPDGFGAAWAVARAWAEDGDGGGGGKRHGSDSREFVARGHDDGLDAGAYAGATVVFVDIAPPVEAARALGEAAARLVVLDHHISARERFAEDPDLENELAAQGHTVHFDLAHSGAILAWEHFHGDTPPPALLRYVEDQDLWSWKLPRSEEVNAAIGSYPRRFDVWDALARRPPAELAAEGEPIVRAQRMEVERALPSAHPISLGTLRVEAVNARFQRSVIGHELALRAAYGVPCGAVYRLTGEEVEVSLYSVGDFDVSRVAARYGGGGHRNAGGFSIDLRTWLRDFL